MAPTKGLQRNARPSLIVEQTSDDGDPYDEESGGSHPLEHGCVEDGYSTKSFSASEDESESGLGKIDAVANDDNVRNEINQVSFGALLEAQEALSRKRKRDSNSTAEQEAKLEGVRSRLCEIRSRKHSESEAGPLQINNKHSANSAAGPPQEGHSRSAESITRHESDSDQEDVGDSDSAPSEEGATTRSRTSKHAPATQSSKRQVTRKRNVIDVPKRTYRDPRFDALHQTQTQPSHSEKAYSFLRDYQKDEIAELKSAIKQTRNEDDKETLKRKVISMENRLKSKDAKDRAQKVLRQHRRDEREKVEQGKRPYFLKRSELKERALVEKFKGMKSKDREKVIEKKKRKESQREMKRMPSARRVID